jgi:tRNA (guanine-N7-)-methyltransferase
MSLTEIKKTLRILPEQWLTPHDFRACFDRPDQPFEIDLGCGKGRFLLARAANFPEINFLGIDRQLNRIRKIDRKAQRAGLKNVRLFRMDAAYATTYLLPPECVDTFYIFYPDPWPKGKHSHNRLFNASFVNTLARTLKPGGKIHASTDHRPYFEEIRKQLKEDPRFMEIEPFVPCGDEVTDFELIFSHKTPGRCSFIRRDPPADADSGPEPAGQEDTRTL